MTVRNLIRLLKCFPPDLPIYFEDDKFCNSREFPVFAERVGRVKMANYPYSLKVDCVRLKG